MNLVIMAYSFLYDNGEINEWKGNNLVKLFGKIGLEKSIYNDIILDNQINGTKLLKLNPEDLKEYKKSEVKHIKIIMKLRNFLRKFYKRFFDYYMEYEKEEEIKVPS